MSRIMLPSEANPAGNVHGGEIMKFMDTTAFVTAVSIAAPTLSLPGDGWNLPPDTGGAAGNLQASWSLWEELHEIAVRVWWRI